MSVPAYQTKSSAYLLWHFIRIYPLRSCIVLFALITAGFIETIGIGALLPLLNIVLETKSDGQDGGVIQESITTIFQYLGIEQNFANLLVVIVMTITLKAVIVFSALKAVSYMAVDITSDLRAKLIKSLMSAKWTFFSALDIGKSSNAIATEADYAGQFCMIMGKAISSTFQVCVYALIAVSVDWKISVAAIFMGGVLAFSMKALIGMTRDAGSEMAKVQDSLLSRMNSSLSGVKPIKAMGEEKRYVDFLIQDTAQLQKSRKKWAFASLLLQSIHEPILVILMAAGLFWAYSVAQYPMSELFMMAFLFSRLLSQINLVQNHYQKSSVFEAAVNAILNKIHNSEHHQENTSGNTEPTFENQIEFKNVSFRYDDNSIFKSLNQTIKANEITVIFGPSGTGKTTFLDLILRLNSATHGEIFIDGVPISTIKISQWRNMIGYVPQETYLFHDTILQNITLGNDNISKEQVIHALKKANAWEFVNQTSEGLNFIVGERGGKLSGGQRQRLALARALVREPNVLILDEATSGLDKNNEAEIMHSLQTLKNKLSVILISHDPDILKIADHVIHLDKEAQ